MEDTNRKRQCSGASITRAPLLATRLKLRLWRSNSPILLVRSCRFLRQPYPNRSTCHPGSESDDPRESRNPNLIFSEIDRFPMGQMWKQAPSRRDRLLGTSPCEVILDPVSRPDATSHEDKEQDRYGLHSSISQEDRKNRRLRSGRRCTACRVSITMSMQPPSCHTDQSTGGSTRRATLPSMMDPRR